MVFCPGALALRAVLPPRPPGRWGSCQSCAPPLPCSVVLCIGGDLPAGQAQGVVAPVVLVPDLLATCGAPAGGALALPYPQEKVAALRLPCQYLAWCGTCRAALLTRVVVGVLAVMDPARQGAGQTVVRCGGGSASEESVFFSVAALSFWSAWVLLAGCAASATTSSFPGR